MASTLPLQRRSDSPFVSSYETQFGIVKATLDDRQRTAFRDAWGSSTGSLRSPGGRRQRKPSAGAREQDEADLKPRAVGSILKSLGLTTDKLDSFGRELRLSVAPALALGADRNSTCPPVQNRRSRAPDLLHPLPAGQRLALPEPVPLRRLRRQRLTRFRASDRDVHRPSRRSRAQNHPPSDRAPQHRSLTNV